MQWWIESVAHDWLKCIGSRLYPLSTPAFLRNSKHFDCGGRHIQRTKRKPGFCICNLWPLESINNPGAAMSMRGWPHSFVFIWREENVRSLSFLSRTITQSYPTLSPVFSLPDSSISHVTSPNKPEASSVSSIHASQLQSTIAPKRSLF